MIGLTAVSTSRFQPLTSRDNGFLDKDLTD